MPFLQPNAFRQQQVGFAQHTDVYSSLMQCCDLIQRSLLDQCQLDVAVVALETSDDGWQAVREHRRGHIAERHPVQ